MCRGGLLALTIFSSFGNPANPRFKLDTELSHRQAGLLKLRHGRIAVLLRESVATKASIYGTIVDASVWIY